jgi:hypothetical protein
MFDYRLAAEKNHWIITKIYILVRGQVSQEMMGVKLVRVINRLKTINFNPYCREIT